MPFNNDFIVLAHLNRIMVMKNVAFYHNADNLTVIAIMRIFISPNNLHIVNSFYMSYLLTLTYDVCGTDFPAENNDQSKKQIIRQYVLYVLCTEIVRDINIIIK